MKPSKCKFFKKTVIHLGHVVSENGIKTDKGKTKTIMNWPTPYTVTEVQFSRMYQLLYEFHQEICQGGKTIVWTNFGRTCK